MSLDRKIKNKQNASAKCWTESPWLSIPALIIAGTLCCIRNRVLTEDWINKIMYELRTKIDASVNKGFYLEGSSLLYQSGKKLSTTKAIINTGFGV